MFYTGGSNVANPRRTFARAGGIVGALALVGGGILASSTLFAHNAEAADIPSAITDITITHPGGTPITNPVGIWENIRIHAQWSVPDSLVEVREFQQGGLAIGGPVYPSIFIICSKCGYSFLLNALIAGIVVPSPKPVESAPPSKPQQS